MQADRIYILKITNEHNAIKNKWNYVCLFVCVCCFFNLRTLSDYALYLYQVLRKYVKELLSGHDFYTKIYKGA